MPSKHMSNAEGLEREWSSIFCSIFSSDQTVSREILSEYVFLYLKLWIHLAIATLIVW